METCASSRAIGLGSQLTSPAFMQHGWGPEIPRTVGEPAQSAQPLDSVYERSKGQGTMFRSIATRFLRLSCCTSELL